MVERVRVREITNDEGNRLLCTVRRSSGSVVTWRRAQMVLLSAQGMGVAMIAQVTFSSPDRVRDVLHNFNTDGFDSLRPKYAGGRPPKFDPEQRDQIKQIALARPTDHGLAFSTWSLSKLADYLVAQGVVDDISQEGLRMLLREQGSPFQAVKTWKTQVRVLFPEGRVADYGSVTAGQTSEYRTAGPGLPVLLRPGHGHPRRCSRADASDLVPR
jgi:transposase